jgi:hypothetical protein
MKLYVFFIVHVKINSKRGAIKVISTGMYPHSLPHRNWTTTPYYILFGAIKTTACRYDLIFKFYPFEKLIRTTEKSLPPIRRSRKRLKLSTEFRDRYRRDLLASAAAKFSLTTETRSFRGYESSTIITRSPGTKQSLARDDAARSTC